MEVSQMPLFQIPFDSIQLEIYFLWQLIMVTLHVKSTKYLLRSVNEWIIMELVSVQYVGKKYVIIMLFVSFLQDTFLETSS